MMKLCLVLILGFQVLHSGGQNQQKSVTNTDEDLNLPGIMERIAQTSPEASEVIEKVKRMTPVLQKNRSGKTLVDAVEDCINGRDQFTIYPIGWEALKSDGQRWTIFFYFKDEEQRYLRAAWEYNNAKNVLLPIEFLNATKFWVRRSANLNP